MSKRSKRKPVQNYNMKGRNIEMEENKTNQEVIGGEQLSLPVDGKEEGVAGTVNVQYDSAKEQKNVEGTPVEVETTQEEVIENQIEEQPIIDGVNQTIEEPVGTPVEDETKIEEETVNSVEVEDNTLQSVVIGKLDGCEKLNVRQEASKESDVVIVVTKEDELILDLEKSTEDFYSVTVKEFNGYVMKKFVKEQE